MTVPGIHANLGSLKFLKVFLNALLGGVYFSGLLALLFLDININLPFWPADLGELTVALFPVYGLLVVILAVCLFFLIQFIGGRRYRIRLISPSFLSIDLSFLTLAFLFFFWENLKYYRSFFDETTAARMELQTFTLAALAVLGFLAVYAFYHHKKKPVYFILYFLVLAAGLTFLAYERSLSRVARPSAKTGSLIAKKIDKKIQIIGLEGLSLDFILPLVAEGKLPNFSWLVDNGAWGRLQTFSPNESLPLNASFHSGKFPSKHRRLSPVTYSLWFSSCRLEVLPRYILIRQLKRLGMLQTHPPFPRPEPECLWRIVASNQSSVLIKDEFPSDCRGESRQRADKAFSGLFQTGESPVTYLLEKAREAFACDWGYEEAALQEKEKLSPSLFHILLNGLNTVQAYFYKYSFPNLFGTIDQEEISRYGSTIEKYYQYYDELIGKYLTSLREDELLVVYSPYGVEALPYWKRFVEWILGNADISAYHEDAPDGAIFFYGKGVRKGAPVEGVGLLDITPTLLYYLGLPVGKDMDGIVRSSIFLTEFTAENPILYIGSYEEIVITPPGR